MDEYILEISEQFVKNTGGEGREKMPKSAEKSHF